jgi:cation diffusion facilitator family transporter
MFEESNPAENQRKLRLAFWSVVATFLALIPTAYAAAISNSTILLADLLRCGSEFFALLLSWLVLREVVRQDKITYNYGLGKLEQVASVTVGVALFLSFLLALMAGIKRLIFPEPLESTLFGFVFATLSVFGNGFLWQRNHFLHKRSPSPVDEAHWKLFRAKTIATLLVALSLGGSMALAANRFSIYFDPLGSLALSLFLLHSAYTMLSDSMPDLVDRSVDEKIQMIIMSTLITHEHQYVGLEKIRTRRAGTKLFVDIFLSFERSTPFELVHNGVMNIKSDLQSHLRHAEVIVIPSLASH